MALVRNISIFALLLATASGAEVTKNKTVAPAAEKKNYNISFSSTLTSSLHETSSIDHQLSNSFSISPTVQLGNGYTFLSSIGGTKNLKGERKFYLGDASLGLNTTLRKFDALTISGTTIVSVPLSEGTKDIQQKRTSISLIPKFIYSAAKGLKLIYTPSATLNFHKYKTALSGASNTQYSLGNTAAASYSAAEWFALTATATYQRSFTYLGNSKDTYSFTQSMTFIPTAETSVTLGHALGGNPLEANGIGNEVKIFDERDSSVFASFSYTY